jgi:hypothetical protein
MEPKFSSVKIRRGKQRRLAGLCLIGLTAKTASLEFSGAHLTFFGDE